MLWEIVGTPHKVLGSVHVLPEAAEIPTWATASYNGTERFIFESDYRIPQNPPLGIDQTGAHLFFPGASEVYHRAKTLLASLGNNDPFEAFLPWKAAFHVVAHFIPQFGMSHACGVDNRSRVWAESNGLKVGFLESPTRYTELLDLSCKRAYGGLDFFDRVVTDTESGAGKLELQRIVRAWFARDLAEFTKIQAENSLRFPVIFAPLLHQRNQEWAPVAQKMIAEKTPTLFVIGALHTVGPGSFLEELRSRGIQTNNISGIGI